MVVFFGCVFVVIVVLGFVVGLFVVCFVLFYFFVMVENV